MWQSREHSLARLALTERFFGERFFPAIASCAKAPACFAAIGSSGSSSCRLPGPDPGVVIPPK